MKEFEFPEMAIITFDVEDILAESNEFPVIPFGIGDEFEIQPIGK